MLMARAWERHGRRAPEELPATRLKSPATSLPPTSELSVPFSRERLIAMRPDLDFRTHTQCVRAEIKVRHLATAPLSRKRYTQLSRRPAIRKRS